MVYAAHALITPVEKMHAGHETVNVVQARRGLGLPETELQRATDHRDGRDHEQADLHDKLACEERRFRRRRRPVVDNGEVPLRSRPCKTAARRMDTHFPT